MRVLMIAPGTRGDVAPMAGLGAELRRHGIDVAIAANPAYAGVVTGAGCEHRELPGDMTPLVAPDLPGEKTTPAILRRYIRELGRYMELAATGALAAARAGADVIVANGVAPFAYDIAEGIGIPALGAHLQPLEPSGAYPPLSLGTAADFTPLGNRLFGSLFAGAKAPFDPACARIRAELALSPKSRRAADAARRREDSLVLHGFSTAVFPRPRDWRAGLRVAGYWWPFEDPAWSPPADLEAFLADGPPPVFIGFGSTGPSDADFMLDVAKRAGVRVVLQGREGISRPDAIGVGTVPHSWLFPRVAAVVHHAGAGTAAAGLRAGVPAVSVPVFGDQPFWARRIHALGAGPKPLPRKVLTRENLAAAVSEATGRPSYTDGARRVAGALASEDGTAAVLASLRELRR